MNLAYHDIRANVGRFVGTSAGIGLLFTVVLAMAGIYQGLVDDATTLARSMHADLWLVQEGTRGPFADVSRLDPTVEARAASVPGVARARAFTYQVLQRDVDGRELRFALVGLPWPDDRGAGLPIVAGRGLGQAHGELVVDASLGLGVGDVIVLAREELRVVGLTRQVLGSGGDAVAFATLGDAQLVLDDSPPDATRTERERRAERLLATDLGRTQPALESLATDPTWQPPALPPPRIAAVLLEVSAPQNLEAVHRITDAWPDVSVYDAGQQESLLLQGLVEKARRQLGLFAAILVATSSVLIAAVIYNMTLDKAHDIAILKLIGAPAPRLVGMVLQQAWAMGVAGFAIAVVIGSQAFPHFPRRVVLTTASTLAVGALVLVVSSVASVLGVVYALRIDPGRALEG